MLTRFSRILALTALVLVFGVLAKPAAADTLVVDDLVCLGPSDVVCDVEVRAGGVLQLDGTCVIGDIKIKPGGALIANNAIIGGNVTAVCALAVDLNCCDIGGKVELKRTGGSGTVLGEPPYINIFASDIARSVRIERSNVFFINVSYNRICGKLVLKNNRTCLPIVCEFNVDCCEENPPPPPGLPPG